MPEGLRQLAEEAVVKSIEMNAIADVRRFVTEASEGAKILNSWGVKTDVADWRPFSTARACIEIDGVFLSTGMSNVGTTFRPCLHFWFHNPSGEECKEIRSLIDLGHAIRRHGTDYRPKR